MKDKNKEKENISNYVGNELPDYYGDRRLLPFIQYNKKGGSYCIYCGAHADSREHLPSRVFLDEPFPKQLAILPSCNSCNNSFSNDELYLACFIEVLFSKVNKCQIQREKVLNALKKNPTLEIQLSETIKTDEEGNIILKFDIERINRVLIKLARGHLMYMLSQFVNNKPDHIAFILYPEMTQEIWDNFHKSPPINIFPELGSRAFRKLLIDQFNRTYQEWETIQENRYRYIVFLDNSLVRIVIGEFLFAEIGWQK